MMSAMAIAKVRRDLSALAISVSTVLQVVTQDASCTAHFSRFKFALYAN